MEQGLEVKDYVTHVCTGERARIESVDGNNEGWWLIRFTTGEYKGDIISEPESGLKLYKRNPPMPIYYGRASTSVGEDEAKLLYAILKGYATGQPLDAERVRRHKRFGLLLKKSHRLKQRTEGRGK